MNPNIIFSNSFNNITSGDITKIKKLREELKKYNMFDFLSQISALILIPENQTKSMIFQAMISTAISIEADEFNSSNIMTRSKLEYFVREFSALNRNKMIDPSEFPFVLPVIYYGNYHIFMGANTFAPHYLNHILKILSVSKDKISSEDYKKINLLVKGLLNASELIFQSLNLRMDDLKSYNKDIDVKIVQSNVLKKYKDFVVFSEDELKSLFEEQYTDVILNFGEIEVGEIDDFDNQKFYLKPFVKFLDKYILTDVTAILLLLVKKIITLFQTLNIDFLNEYKSLILSNLHKDFIHMGYVRLKSTQLGIDFDNNNTIDESLYIIGDDIVFYNIVLFDDGKNYNKIKDYKFPLKRNFISSKIKNVKNKLIEYGFEEDKIVFIIIPTTIGRNVMYEVDLKSNKNLMMLSPYEITAISVNESEEYMFLYKYIVARNRLKNYSKNLFSELNFVALFSNQDRSFYLGDDCDSKEAMLYFIGEYSSDYILKSYLKRNYHLALFNRNSMIEVINKEDGISFAPGLFNKRQLNNLLEFDKFNIWILSEENIDGSAYYITNLIMDTISYWLNQFASLFNQAEGTLKIYLHLDPSMYLIPYDKNKEIGNITYEYASGILNINFEENSLKFFDYPGNDKEKEFMTNIINKICEFYEITILDETINQFFNNKYKKKIIIMNSNEDAYMMPFEEECIFHVSNALSNLILDDVGLYLKNEKQISYGKIEDYTILNDIVGFLFEDIIKKVNIYNKAKLIDFLYLEFEKNLSSLLIRQTNYANDLMCYPERKKIIDEKINDLNRTSVALKFLIELVSSIKIEGTKDVSLYEIEYILTETSKIIDYAYTCDIYHYKMADNTLTLLNSNRLGYKKDFLVRVNYFLKTAKIGRMNPKVKDKRKMLKKYEVGKKDIPGFEDAFEDEFNFCFKDFTEVTVSILELAEQNNHKFDSLYYLSVDEIKKYINGKVDNNTVDKIINYLSQSERDNYLEPPKPYNKVDVFPWRNNRELSLNRKPLVKYNGKIIFGYRSFINSIYFLFEIINNGTLKARSKKMKSYLGLLNKESGEDFNEKTFEYLKTFPNSIVYKKVSKINGKKINDINNNTLGDIDILYISKKYKKIIVCEVKNFELSRNMYEIFNEYFDMFDPSNEKSFYRKHMRRVEWCKNNLNDIVKQYNLEKKKWKIDYCFIVNEPLVSNKAMMIDINAYTLEDIDKFIK